VTTITSRIPALIDYLVTLFTGDPTIGAATPPVTVYDGPPTTALDAQLKLYVGLTDPDNPGAEPAADATQGWAALGRRGRNQQVTIHCCAEAWSGTDSIQSVRLAVAGITAAVETLMQADTTAFGGNVLFPDPGMRTRRGRRANVRGVSPASASLTPLKDRGSAPGFSTGCRADYAAGLSPLAIACRAHADTVSACHRMAHKR
jgi:hypothetical protein